ncbi:MAG: ATP-binding protein [Actinomycetia bacterium]|nr:ATP-binding protein [Actinomycetes bacterium]
MAVETRAVPNATRSDFRLGPKALAMFAFLGVCALVSVVASREVADIAGFIGVFFGSVITGSLFIKRSRRFHGRERRGWSLIGVGVLFAAAGVLSIAIVFFATGDAPAFGLNDLFFFATYVTIIVGFGVLPHTQGSALQRTRMAIDGMVGAVFVGSLLWVYLGSILAENLAAASATTKTIGFGYPFFDLVFITVAVLVLLRRSTRRFDTRLALFIVGVFAQVIADVLFLASAQAGSFDQATPPYALNLIGLAAFFASAYLLGSSPPVREYAERVTPLWMIGAAYLPAVGMLVVFVVDTFISGEPNHVLLAATIIVGLLVIARQGVSIAENRVYIEQQRNALVSTISHELRTPLTAIAGFVEILRERDGSIDDDEQREMLDIVFQQTGYMSRIVSDLIMLARGADSEIELEIREVVVSDLVTSAIHASGIRPDTVVVECRPDLVGFVDPSRLQQVLVNLLTNVERYGGPNRLVRVVEHGSDLTFEVHDDGQGIPRRYEVSVWDRFERGPNKLNAAIPGSGIGLAIVQAIVKAHGGTASYRVSEKLGGACFTVLLPGRGAVAHMPVRGTDVAEHASIQREGVTP